jgi:hypothetical protein
MYAEQSLLHEIEQCRLLMVNLAAQTSLSSHHVIEISTKLDNLLNEYDKCKKQ